MKSLAKVIMVHRYNRRPPIWKGVGVCGDTERSLQSMSLRLKPALLIPKFGLLSTHINDENVFVLTFHPPLFLNNESAMLLRIMSDRLKPQISLFNIFQPRVNVFISNVKLECQRRDKYVFLGLGLVI